MKLDTNINYEGRGKEREKEKISKIYYTSL